MNFFITNREIIEVNGLESVREDGKEKACDNLRFGAYDATSRAFNLFPEPSSPTESVYEIDAATPAGELVGSARFFKQMYDELTNPAHGDKNDVLFFIHGFNTNLQDVRSAFDTLNRCYCDSLSSPIRHVIIFTWPGMSPKVPYHYFNDKQDAIHSGEALARGMEKVVKFMRDFLVVARNEACKRNVHLMVHSMGHRVLKHMMMELHAKSIPVPELFKEVVLMAADIEYTIFEPAKPFQNLIELGTRIHVYYHHHDRVLGISKFTKNFSNRLGSYGRKNSAGQVDILDVDVSSVTDDLDSSISSDLLNHWYYYSSSEVVNDVIRVLTGSPSNIKTQTELS